MDVVDDESEGEDGGFDCLYLDDYCEEIECEEVEHDEQQMTEPCATPKCRGGKGKGRAKDKQGGPRAKKRRLTLNKDEKARVLLSICDVKVENVVLHVDETISSARHVLDNKARQDFWKALQSSKQMKLN